MKRRVRKDALSGIESTSYDMNDPSDRARFDRMLDASQNEPAANLLTDIREEICKKLEGTGIWPRPDRSVQVLENGWQYHERDALLGPGKFQQGFAYIRDQTDQLSYEAFLIRLYRACSSCLNALDGDDRGRIFYTAVEFGAAHQEYKMRVSSLKKAETGKKIRQGLSQRRNARNAAESKRANSDQSKWQQLANQIWSTNPNLSKSAVAKIIKQNNSISQASETIRKALQKTWHR